MNDKASAQDVTASPLFEKVRAALPYARLIAWDGCHKIYLAMDEYEERWFRREYPHTETGTEGDMLKILGEWWEDSCRLRFIQAVRYTPKNLNEGYVNLISQGAGYEDSDDS